MRRLDTALFLATQNDPGGPIITDVEDGIEPMMVVTDDEGQVTKSGVFAYLAAYMVLAALLLYFFLAV